MIKRLYMILLPAMLATSVAAAGLNLECAGKATQVVQGTDTIFVFAGAPELKTSDGSLVDWYLTTDTTTAVLTNSATNYNLSSGDGVAVRVGSRWLVRYVFSYADIHPNIQISDVQPNCRSTIVTVEGTIPEATYRTFSGLNKLERHHTASFTTLAWSGEAWQDSLAMMDINTLHIGANTLDERMLRESTVAICTDGALAEVLGLSRDSVISASVTPHAVSSAPTSVTTVRGEAGEKSNEIERPIEAGTLKGSAPLDILFKSNPTPSVEFFQWEVYFGTQQIAKRSDQDMRFTFLEPGNYRVVSKVLNTFCPCQDQTDPDCAIDSTEFTIAVSVSMLRVPNAFSPNGDGANDEFRVEYRSIKEFHCWVYNRWGKLVYEWTDPAKGWDGTINGQPAPEGAYYYVIRALGTDADKNAGYVSQISYKKKDKTEAQRDALIGVYQLAGDINLLRGKK